MRKLGYFKKGVQFFQKTTGTRTHQDCISVLKHGCFLTSQGQAYSHGKFFASICTMKCRTACKAVLFTRLPSRATSRSLHGPLFKHHELYACKVHSHPQKRLKPKQSRPRCTSLLSFRALSHFLVIIKCRRRSNFQSMLPTGVQRTLVGNRVSVGLTRSTTSPLPPSSFPSNVRVVVSPQ